VGKRAAYVAVANDIIDVGNVANFKRAAFACFCVVAKANFFIRILHHSAYYFVAGLKQIVNAAVRRYSVNRKNINRHEFSILRLARIRPLKRRCFPNKPCRPKNKR
jgi:hypothetical protein